MSAQVDPRSTPGDSGTVSHDAGTVSHDAGTVPGDAGTVPGDRGADGSRAAAGSPATRAHGTGRGPRRASSGSRPPA